MNSYIKILKKNRLKITIQRQAVINLFSTQKFRMGPYDVYKKLKKQIPRLGLPTVYRILDELSNLGILVRVLSNNRQLYYALCSFPHQCHHHHFICRKCKQVEEVEYCNFKEVSRYITNTLNGKAEFHSLHIEGLCSGCNKE